MAQPSRNLTMTLTSLWSAMLGGALGAAVGSITGPLLCTASIGFAGGFLFSALLYLPLMGAMQALALVVMNHEIEGRPIGCTTSDRLSAILGGAAGGVGAIVVAALPEEYDLLDPHVFVACWTVAAFVPIMLSVALVMIARWQERS